MDANKAKTLREIGYELSGSCGNCEHGTFSSNTTIFGTCTKFAYYHQKHEEDRQLSVNRYGSCPEYVATQAYELIVQHFEF